MKMNTNIKRTFVSLLVALGMLFSGLAPAMASQRSPISISESKVVQANLPAITFNNIDPYLNNSAFTLNYVRGVTKEEDNIQAIPANPSIGATVQGVFYKLQNMHWHVPSEHTLSVLSPQRSPMEQHMVFASAQGKTMVLASMLQVGASQTSATLSRIVDAMPIASQGVSGIGYVQLGALLNTTGDRYNYTGSLTTSPYTGNVQWVVYESPLKVSQSTIDKLASLLPLGNNSAPTNPVEPSTTIYHGKV